MKQTVILNEGLRRLSNCLPAMPWKDKAYWLTELNLFMLQGGYNYRFRRLMTDKIVRIYSNILDRHNKGTLMYREQSTTIKAKNKTDWFKKLGYKYSFQIPQTINRQLANSVKTKLESYSGQKILIQEKLGKTVCSTLARSNPNPKPNCHRQNCKICLTHPSKGRCYQSNIGYRIICNRKPCTNNIDTRKLDNRQFRQQIENLKPTQTVTDRPAAYESETYRSAYTRSQSHWQKYNSKKKSQQSKSFMFHHTATAHGGTKGPNKGEKDYLFHITDRFQDNLSRQIDEGRRQTVIEQYQTDNKLTVLNSKIDFCQPLRTNLAVISKTVNIIPGKTDNQSNNLRQSTPLYNPNYQTVNTDRHNQSKVANRRTVKGVRRIQTDSTQAPRSQTDKPDNPGQTVSQAPGSQTVKSDNPRQITNEIHSKTNIPSKADSQNLNVENQNGRTVKSDNQGQITKKIQTDSQNPSNEIPSKTDSQNLNIKISNGRTVKSDNPGQIPKKVQSKTDSQNPINKIPSKKDSQILNNKITSRRTVKGIRRINVQDDELPLCQFTPKVTSTPRKSHKLDPYISNKERSPANKKMRVRFAIDGVPTNKPG